jgi:hypothetical protein
MRRGIVVQLEPTVLCWKWWPQPGNELQQSSDNFKIDNNIDLLPLRHELFMNHKLFVKKCDQHSSDLGLLPTKCLGLGGDFKLIIKNYVNS